MTSDKAAPLLELCAVSKQFGAQPGRIERLAESLGWHTPARPVQALDAVNLAI
ncbi:MAG: peptide ABC transporter ATP-binding protein, partial [Betaproteobacteria bacterium HGW-Betaproteobacteria-21]